MWPDSDQMPVGLRLSLMLRKPGHIVEPGGTGDPGEGRRKAHRTQRVSKSSEENVTELGVCTEQFVV